MRFALNYYKAVFNGYDAVEMYRTVRLAQSNSYRELESLVEYFDSKYGDCPDEDSYRIVRVGDRWSEVIHNDPDLPKPAPCTIGYDDIPF